MRPVVRALARRPGVSALAIISLAIAIGLSTAAFSILDAFELRDLPVSDPAHLAYLRTLTREQRMDNMSWIEYQALASKAHSFSGIVAEDRISPPVKLPDGDDFPITAEVSDNYFDVLGIRAARGDLFHTGRAQDGTVVISHHYWKDRLGSDPHVIGRILPVGPFGQITLRIMGIAPPGFTGTVRGILVDLFLPPQVFFGPRGHRMSREDTSYELTARLRAGATLADARTETDAILRQVEKDGLAPAPGRRSMVEPFSGDFTAKLEANAVVLGMIVLLVVIAAANLANLRLVDNETRRHETGIRLALGAGRAVIARQHLAETLVLSGAATALGLIIARWLIAAAPALFYSGRRYIDFGIRLDARTFAFSSAALLAVAIIGTFIPLSDAWRHRLLPSLHGARATKPTRWLTVLVVAQMSIVTGVTCSAGLFWRSLEKISAVRPAMDPDRSLLLVQGNFMFRGRVEAVPPRLAALSETLARLPGVRQVAWARRAMLSGSGGGATVDIEMPGQPKFAIPFNQVSPNYFAATGARILRGRPFRDSDSPEAAPVVLISSSFARRFFPDRNPLSQWVRIEGKNRQVIGIVEDGPQNHLLESVQPYAYFPFAQMPIGGVTLFVETQRDPATLAAAVRSIIRSSGSDFIIWEMTTMREHMRLARSNQEIAWQITGALALTGLLLAAAGLFGVTLFAVARRTPEFGIRVAMGATPRRLARQVMAEAGRRVAIALPIGWLLAFLARHTIAKLLYGVAPDDPWTFAAAGAVVCIIGCLAALHPALRAARTDPASALRQE